MTLSAENIIQLIINNMSIPERIEYFDTVSCEEEVITNVMTQVLNQSTALLSNGSRCTGNERFIDCCATALDKFRMEFAKAAGPESKKLLDEMKTTITKQQEEIYKLKLELSDARAPWVPRCL